MKNIETKTDLEIILDYLNQFAKSFEDGRLLAKEFLPLCTGAIKYAENNGSLDRIQSRLLLDQAIDISNKEYTRFCDPDDDYPEPITEGYDSQGYAI